MRPYKTSNNIVSKEIFYASKPKFMADNKQNIGNPDRSRINVNEEYELNAWCRKFNVNPSQLKKAVKEVGSIASDVEAYLNKDKTSSGRR